MEVMLESTTGGTVPAEERETSTVARRPVEVAAFGFALVVSGLALTFGTYVVLLNTTMCTWGDPCGSVRPAVVANGVVRVGLLALLVGASITKTQPSLRIVRTQIGSVTIAATSVAAVVKCNVWAAASVPP